MMIGFKQRDGLAGFARVRQAMAVSLFKDRRISVAGAAKLANEPLGVMLTRLARLGVPAADYDASALAAEVAHGAAWPASASAVCCRAFWWRSGWRRGGSDNLAGQAPGNLQQAENWPYFESNPPYPGGRRAWPAMNNEFQTRLAAGL